MRTKSVTFEFDGNEDQIDIELRPKDAEDCGLVTVIVSNDWEIYIGNDCEERAFRIVKTGSGGYTLKQRELL